MAAPVTPALARPLTPSNDAHDGFLLVRVAGGRKTSHREINLQLFRVLTLQLAQALPAETSRLDISSAQLLRACSNACVRICTHRQKSLVPKCRISTFLAQQRPRYAGVVRAQCGAGGRRGARAAVDRGASAGGGRGLRPGRHDHHHPVEPLLPRARRAANHRPGEPPCTHDVTS